MKKQDRYDRLGALFFETRQIIRDNLREEKPDVNAWLRLETLRFVAAAGNPTMHDIAGHLRIKAPSATSLIAHLIREGWLSRVKNGADKRVVRIAVSAEGKRTLSRYRARCAGTMRRVFSKLPVSDLERLLRILENVRDAHR